MDLPRLSKSVRRVTVLQKDGSGTVTPVAVYRKKKGKKKQSRFMSPTERVVRRMVDATEAATNQYLTRHKKSNRKRRDGWVRDLNLNMARAWQKGVRRVRLGRMFLF